MIRISFKLKVVFLAALIASLSVSAAFAQSGSTDTPSGEKKSPQTVKRDSPLKTLFDQSSAQVEAVADSIEYQKNEDKVVARGNAVLTYKNMKLLADYAEVETTTKKAYAKGHVLIFKDGEPVVKGNEAFYDFENHSGSFPDGRAISTIPGTGAASNAAWFAKGREIKQVKDGVFKVSKGSVTTCDRENPHYEVRCTKATVYSGVKVRMYNATVYVLGKPVFWLPYLVIPLNWNIPFQATAGYKSQYGAYIELSKGITFNQYLSGKWHADWREQRGFGGGWDQDYDFGKYAKGDVKLYWTQDKRAPTPGATNDAGQLDPWANRQDRDRGRITWRHRTDINENTNIIMRYHRVADEYFLQDFFEREYRAEQEPHSFVTATHNTERYGAMVHVTKRMNSFEGIVERLPEGRLDWKNQPFFTEKVYNVSRVQVDNLNLLQSRSSSSAKAVRADGYSTFIAPVKFKDVNFTPLLGYRGTEYSRDAFGNNSHFRQILEYGADLRTHAYRVMDVSFDKMGIEVNQLRHIFEPSVALKGQAASMTSINKVTHFDNIDTLDSSSEVVFGIDNRLQTKRVLHGKSQRVDLVSLNTYVHYAFINPDTTTSGGGGFKLVENELTLRPYDWLQFQSRLEVDLSSNYIKLCNNDIVVRRGRWRFLFGQRYVHDQYDYLQAMSIPEAQQFVTDGQYKVNDLWSVGGYIRWDTANGNLQEWQLSASRDLHDFILDFGYNTRNSLIDNSNKSLFFTFRMKAMPQFNLGGGGGIAAFSEPRIGETVAGANENWGRYSTSREQQFWGFPQ